MRLISGGHAIWEFFAVWGVGGGALGAVLLAVLTYNRWQVLRHPGSMLVNSYCVN